MNIAPADILAAVDDGANTTKQIARWLGVCDRTAAKHLATHPQIARVIHHGDPARGRWQEWVRCEAKPAAFAEATVRDALQHFTAPVSAHVLVAHMKARRGSYKPPTLAEEEVVRRQLRALLRTNRVTRTTVTPLRRTDARVLYQAA